MASEPRDNSGSLFKNDRKTEPKHPDYKGSALVNGVEYWLSAWIKVAGEQAKNPGSKFMSIALTAKEKRDTPYSQPDTPKATTPPTEDIPF